MYREWTVGTKFFHYFMMSCTSVRDCTACPPPVHPAVEPFISDDLDHVMSKIANVARQKTESSIQVCLLDHSVTDQPV
jgi:hypothetical protein